jgi:hypothetical protein
VILNLFAKLDMFHSILCSMAQAKMWLQVNSGPLSQQLTAVRRDER